MGETGTELGMALGIAIMGSLVTAVYRAGVTDSSGDSLSSAIAAAAMVVILAATTGRLVRAD